MRIALLALASLLFAAACSGGSGIGSRCAGRTDCPSALECIVQAQGGYCTFACTLPGEQGRCPGDSVCAQIFSGEVVCLKRCTAQADCRPDTDCTGITGSGARACRPRPRD